MRFSMLEGGSGSAWVAHFNPTQAEEKQKCQEEGKGLGKGAR